MALLPSEPLPFGARRRRNGVLALVAVLALLLAVALAVPAGAQVTEGQEHCVVNVAASDRLNMRSAPNANAPIVARKDYGSCGITVMGACQANWCPVEDGHNGGWMSRRYLSMVSPALYCVTGIAADDVLNLRAFPSAQSRVLTTIPPNGCDIAFLPYSVGNWQKIRRDGWEGWANRLYLSGE